MEAMAGTTIDTTVLTILGAAFGVMFATLTTLLVTSIRFQHRDSIQTRDLINKNRELIEQSNNNNRDLINKNRELIEQSNNNNRELINKNRELIEQSNNNNRELIEQSKHNNRELTEQSNETNRKLIERATEKLTSTFNENTRVTQGKLDKIVTSLSDARERLARIEGHLGIGLPARSDPESNGDNSEAA